MPVQPDAFHVLFVCTGNICRSPLAERLLVVELTRRLGDASRAVVVESAGVQGLVGEPMDPPAAEQLRALGGDPDGFAARLLDEDVVRGADLILTASRKHRATVVRRVPGATLRTFTVIEFARLAQHIDPAKLSGESQAARLAAAVKEAGVLRGTKQAEDRHDDDVGDPFRGTEADHLAAAQAIAPAVSATADLLAEVIRPGSSRGDTPSEPAEASALPIEAAGGDDGATGVPWDDDGGGGEPNERSQEQRKRRRWPLTLLLVVFVLLAAVAWLAWEGLQARNDLQAARPVAGEVRDAVLAGDVPQARAGLATLQERTATARERTDGPLWWLAGHLPIVGDDVDAVQTMAETLDDVSRGVLPPLVDAGQAARPAQLLAAGDTIDLAPLVDAQPALRTAARLSAAASARLALVDGSATVGPVRSALEDVRGQVDDLAGTARTADTAATVLPPMLGADGKRRYFLAFQNNAEARGTGGLLGAYGVLEADRGHIAVRRLGSNTELDPLRRMPINLGKDFRQLYGNDPALWVNSNVSPHFPYAAQIWLELWRRQFGDRLDGVIATDPVAMGYMLGATGPATLPSGEQVTADNAAELSMSEVYERFPKAEDNPERDEFLQQVARAVTDKLLSGSADAAQLVDALQRAGTEGRLLTYSRYGEEQHRLAQTSLGGTVHETEAPYAGLIVNNAAGNKLDYYLERSLRHELGSCPGPGGRRESKITATLTNAAPRGLPEYVELTVDRDSGELGRARTGSTSEVVQIYATKGAGLVRATLDGKPLLVTPGRERGHPVFQVGLDIKRGQTRTIVLELLEPVRPEAPELARAQPLVRDQDVRQTGDACPRA